jgi:hypothetical protein
MEYVLDIAWTKIIPVTLGSSIIYLLGRLFQEINRPEPLYFNPEALITRKDLVVREFRDGTALVDASDVSQVYFFNPDKNPNRPPFGRASLDSQQAKVLERCALFATKSPVKFINNGSIAFDEITPQMNIDEVEYHPHGMNYSRGIALPLGIRDRYPDKKMKIYCNYHNYVVVEWVDTTPQVK